MSGCTKAIRNRSSSPFVVGARPDAFGFARATLMGDAVHAMPPFGAHGGNTALRDAALLGRKLTSAFNPAARSRRRLPRTSRRWCPMRSTPLTAQRR
jgi:2-polyprenyl-6-methoxyphenol hydroxylase-like FAD-dependent oxidoreductase